MKNKIYFGRGEGVPAIPTETKKTVRDVIKRTLENENFAYGAEISVTFVLDSESIAERTSLRMCFPSR